YATSDTPTELDKVNTGEWIVITGENLEGATSVVFNSEELDITEAYAQWDMMVITVPEDLPAEINNKLVYTTSLGSCEIDLGLVLPAAQFNYVENEFELQGNTTKIFGKNFSVYGFDSDPVRSWVVLSNEVESYEETLTMEWCDDENLKVTIPTDAPNNSLFKFILEGDEDAQRLHYRPTDLLLFGDVELTNNVTVTDGVTITYTDGTQSGDPECLIPNGIDGNSTAVKYFRIVGDAPSGWYSYINIPSPTIYFTMPNDKTADDYYFVFELNTSASSSIPTGTTYLGQLPKGSTFTMWEDSGATEKSTNGEWTTCRIDLSIVSGTIVGSETTTNNNFMMKSNYAMTGMDHSFANFRIEPKLP
ncbi:MAG: hypothetical protein SNH35_07280, partial [Rikenellaceae bacterium]